MKKIFILPFILLSLILPVCRQKTQIPSLELINAIQLKRGQVISCGAPGKQFGKVNFTTTCRNDVKEDFNLAVELLHSFEYEESEKVFARIIDNDPGCAMAYWGVAMSNFHALWTPPTEAELKKGLKAVTVAKSLEVSKREKEYIGAIASFYQDWEKLDHHTRCLKFEKGMGKVYSDYPGDIEAAIFYALALDAAASPEDLTFSKQKQAGAILKALYVRYPDHPGIAHYLIHTFDYPELAQEGLAAARNYASIAPSSAHALHMPSHIFTRLGLWDECIQSNQVSVASARCYAETAGIKGHWDEELHGLDYLVYAYLQKGENDTAKRFCNYLRSISEVYPVNFKVAYAFAAIPSRYVLENRMWKEAAQLRLTPVDFPWESYPWQEAILHFTRALGCVHSGNLGSAIEELNALDHLHEVLMNQKDSYKANQVDIQMKAAGAWIKLKTGKSGEALTLMQMAADMEDKTQKHPVTPCEVIPARELLADMLLDINIPDKALINYEADLEKHPNRFNALFGAGKAAERTGNTLQAENFYKQLIIIADSKSNRPEINYCKQFLKRNKV